MGFSVIGKSLPRKDDPLRATGKAKFTADFFLPGMLYGKILRSPYPHARILNIDTTKAERLSGVKKVVTGKDTLGIKFGVTGFIPPSFDEYALAIEKVRYIGDEVAAVAAISEEIAEEALDLIEVEYEQLPAVFDPIEAMKPGAPEIHDLEHVKNNISLYVDRNFGDVEKAFKDADYVREDEFYCQPVDHAPMEAHVSLADYDVSGKLTLWTSTQSPYYVHKHLERTLGLKESQIRVIKPYTGGGFGDRAGGMSACEFCAALLSIKTGRPVRISYTREEETSTSPRRHPMKVYLKSGVKKDGTLLASHYKLFADTGAYNNYGCVSINIPIEAMTVTYRVPSVRYEGYLVYTNTQPSGAMRGHAHNQPSFALDTQLDLIAEELGIDPIDIRIKNARQEYETSCSKIIVGSCGFTRCLEQSRDLSDWNNRKKKQKQGRGIGVGTMSFASGAAFNFFGAPSGYSAATVRLLDDGTVTVLTGASDIGQGSDGTLSMIAAEELGVSMNDIRIISADTELTPVDYGSYSSRVTMFAGNAVKSAASDAKMQLFETVAKKLEANIEDLEAKDRRIYVKGSIEKGMSFAEAICETMAANKMMPVIGKGNYNPHVQFNMLTGEGNCTPAYSFASYVAEVEVDKETGVVKVPYLVAAHDCGRAINPTRVEGQLEGSVQMGLGHALMEELVMDKGLVLNSSFLDYKFPTALEMPSIKSVVVEAPDPHGPFGAKESGEGTTIPVVPSIGNAIYDAIGVRLKEMPFTPEKILKALEEKEKRT